MRRLPPISQAHKFPVTSATALAACIATAAWHLPGMDVDALVLTPEWPRKPWH